MPGFNCTIYFTLVLKVRKMAKIRKRYVLLSSNLCLIFKKISELLAHGELLGSLDVSRPLSVVRSPSSTIASKDISS